MDIAPATESDKAAIQLYADLMGEVKNRMLVISRAVAGELNNLPAPAIGDLCYLQLRMICELIALGCLVAHEDISATHPLRRSYAADEIMNLMERLHPDFYPRPMRQTETKPRTFHLEPIKDGFLTKDEHVRLVRHCGSNLHRGSLRNLLSGKSPLRIDLTEVDQYSKKIANLLNVHCLSRLGGQTQFHCAMHAINLNGEVGVSLGRAVPQSSNTDPAPPSGQ